MYGRGPQSLELCTSNGFISSPNRAGSQVGKEPGVGIESPSKKDLIKESLRKDVEFICAHGQTMI